MKKIILVAIVILSFAACTNSKAPEVNTAATDTVVVAPTETVVAMDSVATPSAVATATK